MLNGRCKICPAYKHPDLTGKLCVSDPCSGNKILKEDGRCYPCDAGTRPDETGRACKKDPCDLLTQYHDDLGYCISCPLFTKPNENNTACHPDDCMDNQKLKEDGTCEDCDDYFHPDTTGKLCVQCDMTGRERDIWTITGECSTCPDYYYAGPNKHECLTDECDEDRDFKQLDGTCYSCPENYYPKQIDLKCEQETCDPRTQYVNKFGRCETCEAGTHPFANETFRGCLRSCPYGIAENNICPCPDG